MTRTWSEVDLPHVGKRVTRLGLATNYGLPASELAWAADQGVNYWFWWAVGRNAASGAALAEILKKDRERHVVAVQAGGWFPWMVRWSIDAARKRLGIDQIDVYVLSWLGVTSAYTPGILDVLRDAQAKGHIRTIGTAIHDRARAASLVDDSAIDLFMLRYNAAHPGAEREVFPHLPKRDPVVCAYTGTSWGQLLKPAAGYDAPWPGRDAGRTVPPMTAGLCYRFQLQNPHVHLALTGPANRAQLEDNLRALRDGPLTPEEEAWVRGYGAVIAGKSQQKAA
jgi:aryl-alcohol dehydrogenase-like predicted oxidoreductase